MQHAPSLQNWTRVIKFTIGLAVNSGLIPSRVNPMTLKLVFTAFLLDAKHEGDSVENKPASSLVVLLGKVLNGIPPS